MSLFHWRNIYLCTIQTVVPDVFGSNRAKQYIKSFVKWSYIFCSWIFSKLPNPWSLSLPNLMSCELLFDALFVVVISRFESWDCLIIISISEKLLDVVQNHFWVFQRSKKWTPAGFPPDPVLMQNSMLVLVKATFMLKPSANQGSGGILKRSLKVIQRKAGQTFG